MTRFAPLLACLALILTAQAALADITGVWTRVEKQIDGQPSPAISAALIIEPTALSFIGSEYTPDECSFSGALAITPTTLTVTIAVTACPPPATGETLVYDYILSGETLTTTHNRAGMVITETFTKSAPDESQACSHPYCGTWLRVGTYVDGSLMNQAWSVAVIRNTDYYAVAEACANYLTIDSVSGQTVTQTMVSHDCPSTATPPGTLFVSQWILSPNKQSLQFVNNQYGASVRTDLIRLEDPLPIP